MKTGGYVYAIGAVGTRRVKIGLTRGAVEERLQALQTEHPSPLTLLAVVRVQKHLDRVTKHVHAFLSVHHLSDAWFAVRMDTQMLEALVTRAQQVLTSREQSRRAAARGLRIEGERRTLSQK